MNGRGLETGRPRIQPAEVARKRFRIRWRGFDPVEVGEFLSRLARDYEIALADGQHASELADHLSQLREMTA